MNKPKARVLPKKLFVHCLADVRVRVVAMSKLMPISQVGDHHANGARYAEASIEYGMPFEYQRGQREQHNANHCQCDDRFVVMTPVARDKSPQSDDHHGD